jgi:hypothetical protein
MRSGHGPAALDPPQMTHATMGRKLLDRLVGGGEQRLIVRPSD